MQKEAVIAAPVPSNSNILFHGGLIHDFKSACRSVVRRQPAGTESYEPPMVTTIRAMARCYYGENELNEVAYVRTMDNKLRHLIESSRSLQESIDLLNSTNMAGKEELLAAVTTVKGLSDTLRVELEERILRRPEEERFDPTLAGMKVTNQKDHLYLRIMTSRIARMELALLTAAGTVVAGLSILGTQVTNMRELFISLFGFAAGGLTDKAIGCKNENERLQKNMRIWDDEYGKMEYTLREARSDVRSAIKSMRMKLNFRAMEDEEGKMSAAHAHSSTATVRMTEALFEADQEKRIALLNEAYLLFGKALRFIDSMDSIWKHEMRKVVVAERKLTKHAMALFSGKGALVGMQIDDDVRAHFAGVPVNDLKLRIRMNRISSIAEGLRCTMGVAMVSASMALGIQLADYRDTLAGLAGIFAGWSLKKGVASYSDYRRMRVNRSVLNDITSGSGAQQKEEKVDAVGVLAT